MSGGATRSSRLALAASLAALVVLAALVLPRLDVATDMSFFMPSSATPEIAALNHGMTGSGSLLMIGLRADDAAAAAAASDALVRTLRGQPGFLVVSNGRPYLPPDMLNFVLDNSYLLGPAPDMRTLDNPGLQERLHAGLLRLGGVEGWLYRDVFPRDPADRLAEFSVLLRTTEGPDRRFGVWMNDDGQALILARLGAPAGDIAGQAAARTAVSDAVAALGEGALSWVASGPGQFALEASERIQEEMRLLSAVATGAVAVLLIVAFHTPVVLVLVGLPVAFGLLAGIAVAQALFGQVHGVAITFGAVLVGVAADYVIHLAGLRDAAETPAAAARRLARPLLLGAGTTLAGLLALSQSSFPGLAQIGTVAATAVLVAALFSRWILPSLMPRRPLRPPGGGTAWRRLKSAPRARRLGRWLVLAAVAGLCAAAWAAPTPLWEDRLDRLSVSSPQRRALDHDLRTALHLPDVARLVLIEGRDADDVLARQAELFPILDQAVTEGRLGGYHAAASLLPPVEVQEARQSLLPSGPVLRSRLNEATDALPLDASAFSPFLDTVGRQKEGPPLRPEDIAASPFAGLIDGPWPVEREGEGRGEGSWAGITALVPPVALAPDDVTIGRLIDLRQVASAMVLAYRNEALWWLALGSVGAVALLWAILRRPKTIAIAMAPSVAAVVATAALLVASGTSLSIFHILALLLVASIGVDYALFFTGYSADEAAGSRSLHSVALCSATTVSVFGILGLSSLPILSSIGVTVAIGSGLCLPLTLILCED